MKTHRKLLSVSFLSLIACIAQAAHLSAAQFPADLRYENKPIDPLCFFNLAGKESHIDLTNCGIAKSGYAVSGENTLLTKEGFYGFDYRDAKANHPAGGSSYYKVWDAGNHHYWLYTANNGGGSGDFTNLYLISRVNNTTVSLKEIAGGDRCNGGINHVEQTNYQLDYSVNITPFDFLTLANYNPFNLKPYDDLAACATCCAAKAYYSIEERTNHKFLHVDLGSNKKVEELPTQGKHQACFNKLFGNFQRVNLTRLNDKGLYRFADEFYFLCVR